MPPKPAATVPLAYALGTAVCAVSIGLLPVLLEMDGAVEFTCVVPPTGCSQEGEKCATAPDCCGASTGSQCINGFCAQPSPK